MENFPADLTEVSEKPSGSKNIFHSTQNIKKPKRERSRLRSGIFDTFRGLEKN